MYTYEEAFEASKEYFNGDELAAKVFVDKYALRNNEGNLLEKTPEDMHWRLAKEFARVEKKKYKNTNMKPLGEEEIFSYLDKFKYIIPQGSPMAGIGNKYQYVSLSNCFLAGTRVLTINEGIKNIEDVIIGDEVITHLGNIKKVVQTHKNLVNNREIFELKCFRTPKIFVTDNHNLFSITQEQLEWKELPTWNAVEHLRKGDFVAIGDRIDTESEDLFFDLNEIIENMLINNNRAYKVIKDRNNEKISLIYHYKTKKANQSRKHRAINSVWKIDENFAYFIGLWYGDGCVFSDKSNKIKNTGQRNRKKINKDAITRGITFTFNAKESKLIDFVINYGEKLFGINSDVNNNIDIDGSTQIVFHSSLIGCVFEKLFGRGYSGKRLNKHFYRWPKNFIKKLILGLVDSDGTVTKDGDVRVTLNNKELIEEIYHLARSYNFALGISHSVNKHKYSRLDFPKHSIFLENCNKHYDDERIKIAKSKEESTFHVIEINKKKFVKIDKKIKCKDKPKYVYTLGIEDDHSYLIEGILALNCYVVPPPYDSYGGILKTDEHIVQISKRRGGIGFDISTLRAKDSSVTNSAKTSTGAISFMHRFSHTGREVGQNSRRAAIMMTMSVHHPDILEFIKVKSDKTKVTGANISVRLSNEFLEAVRKNKQYQLRWPVNSVEPQISKYINANLVWNEIVTQATHHGEPGVIFWNNIIDESPADCYENYQTLSTNPCCVSSSKPVSVTVSDRNGFITNKNIQQITSKDKIWLCTTKTNGPCATTFGDNQHDNNNICEFLNTTNYFESGIADVYKVDFGIRKNGHVEYRTSLYLTMNHKLEKFDTKEMVPLNKLKIGDEISYTNGQPGYIFSQYAYEIINIKYYDTESVGCIEVDKYRRFQANGLIISNSEIPLSPFDSCRLLCLNLFNYVNEPFTKKAFFDWELFYKHSQLAQRLMDDLVDLEVEHVNRIIDKIKSDPEPKEIKENELRLWEKIKEACTNGHRTGTGITALGDALAAMNIKYSSKRGIRIAEEIYKTLKFGCYRASVDMAKELGPFPVWEYQLEKNNPFLNRIKEEYIEELDISGKTLYKDMKKYGRRNIALLTIAPTGTVSLQTQTSSGIEPVFKLKYTRRKKGNPGDNNFRTDFIDENGDHWQEFEVYHPKVKMWMEISGENNVEKSPWWNECAEDLNWTNRVKLQAAIQKHCDHAISSTLNLPEDVDVEEVKKIYETAWKSGCKGITVYRKNSRSGVLVETDQKTPSSHERPNEVPCEVYHVTVRGNPHFVLVGLVENKPYEVFAGKNGIIKKNIQKGKIVKVKKGVYNAILEDGNELTPSDFCTEDEEGVARMTSIALRGGTDIHEIVTQLEKVRGNMQSFAKSMARALKKYIPDGTAVDEVCPKCDSKSMARQEGCVTCMTCGYSRCS